MGIEATPRGGEVTHAIFERIEQPDESNPEVPRRQIENLFDLVFGSARRHFFRTVSGWVISELGAGMELALYVFSRARINWPKFRSPDRSLDLLATADQLPQLSAKHEYEDADD